MIINQERIVSFQDLEKWFEVEEKNFASKKYNAHLVANFDETMATLTKQLRLRVVCRRNDKPFIKGIKTQNTHMTIGLTVFLDGTKMDRSIVVEPLENLQSFVDKTLYNNFNYLGQSKGWITKELFLSWLKNVRMLLFVLFIQNNLFHISGFHS